MGIHEEKHVFRIVTEYLEVHFGQVNVVVCQQMIQVMNVMTV